MNFQHLSDFFHVFSEGKGEEPPGFSQIFFRKLEATSPEQVGGLGGN